MMSNKITFLSASKAHEAVLLFKWLPDTPDFPPILGFSHLQHATCFLVSHKKKA